LGGGKIFVRAAIVVSLKRKTGSIIAQEEKRILKNG
jgi:hypothetical protein